MAPSTAVGQNHGRKAGEHTGSLAAVVSRGIQMLGILSREGKQLLYLGHRNLTFGPTWPQGSSGPELRPADLSLSG